MKMPAAFSLFAAVRHMIIKNAGLRIYGQGSKFN